MNLQEFAEKYVKKAVEVDAEWGNPLRIRGDGFYRHRERQVMLMFKHRSDTDLAVMFTANTGRSEHDSYIDGLRYLRRRMSYTHMALQLGDSAEDQMRAWQQTGIHVRLRDIYGDEAVNNTFRAHVSVYKAVREFMGDEIFSQFLDARDGGDNDGEN